MRAYLDANVLISLFAPDIFTAPAEDILSAGTRDVFVSDFACAEFASGISRLVRMGTYGAGDAQAIFSSFDVWTARSTERIETLAADMKAAEAFVRRLDLALRAPDALHIAMAQRAGATLVTFDQKMVESARALGLQVEP